MRNLGENPTEVELEDIIIESNLDGKFCVVLFSFNVAFKFARINLRIFEGGALSKICGILFHSNLFFAMMS